ncbi:MAG: GNAT family N-acetyltransferase [Clostridia bacterium]|nr:GNAT family N-acetyltransferase [Clostridia bacterium]
MMDNVAIRRMRPQDEQDINAALRGMGWEERPGLYLKYIEEEKAGKRATFVAEKDGVPLGYVTLLKEPEHGPFAGKKWPEIMDFNVFEAYRRQGVGAALMDAAEAAAAEFSDTITFGVGLYDSYGSAQRMYVKRGYIPDGSGVWYQGKPLPPYEPCCNDDDLALYFSKPTARTK